MNSRTALIDADFFAYYILFNKKEEDGSIIEKSFKECTDILDDFLSNLLKMTNCDGYVLCLTTSKCFRYKVFEDYKANRKGLEKPPYFKEFIQYLIDKYNAISHPDLEADDLVLIHKNLIENSVIISPDKDILSCIAGTHFNPRKNEYVTTSDFDANRNFWASMIVGDSIDGIPGLKGKGIKFVDKLFNEVIKVQFSDAKLVGESWSVLNPYYIRVLQAYYDHYKEFDIALEEYYKTYKCLKILDNHPDFDISKIKINLVDRKVEF